MHPHSFQAPGVSKCTIITHMHPACQPAHLCERVAPAISPRIYAALGAPDELRPKLRCDAGKWHAVHPAAHSLLRRKQTGHVMALQSLVPQRQHQLIGSLTSPLPRSRW